MFLKMWNIRESIWVYCLQNTHNLKTWQTCITTKIAHRSFTIENWKFDFKTNVGSKDKKCVHGNFMQSSFPYRASPKTIFLYICIDFVFLFKIFPQWSSSVLVSSGASHTLSHKQAVEWSHKFRLIMHNAGNSGALHKL